MERPRKASMKVPPKRKGNEEDFQLLRIQRISLNESPSEKEGKFFPPLSSSRLIRASMKVPPKRKGNGEQLRVPAHKATRLNESPSEKEGKSFVIKPPQSRFPPQ